MRVKGDIEKQHVESEWEKRRAEEQGKGRGRQLD